MKKLIIIAFIALGILPATMAQKGSQYYTVDYSTATLLGQSSNFAPGYSWRGMAFSGVAFVHDNIAVGVKFGFNNFYAGKEEQLYDLGDGTRIYASTYNYIKMVPFGVSLYFSPLPDNMVQPYLGFTIGSCYTLESVYLQDIRTADDQYSFSIAPEIGLYAQLGQSPTALRLSVSYNYVDSKYEFGGNTFNNIQALTANIGITCKIQ